MSEYSIQLEAFKKQLPVDRTQLGEECLNQPTLYWQIGELVSGIKSNARIMKDNLEFVTARLKKDARQNPGMFGIAKVTESALDEAIHVHNDYRDAVKKYSEAQYLSDCASVLLASVEQRKSMLREAVSLTIHELYSAQQDMSGDRAALLKAESNVTEDEIRQARSAARREHQVDEEDHDECK